MVVVRALRSTFVKAKRYDGGDGPLLEEFHDGTSVELRADGRRCEIPDERDLVPDVVASVDAHHEFVAEPSRHCVGFANDAADSDERERRFRNPAVGRSFPCGASALIELEGFVENGLDVGSRQSDDRGGLIEVGGLQWCFAHGVVIGLGLMEMTVFVNCLDGIVPRTVLRFEAVGFAL